MVRKEMEFEFERATKNIYRFQDKSPELPVFGSKKPKKVKVTVEWE
jgi:hypothetical protein